MERIGDGAFDAGAHANAARAAAYVEAVTADQPISYGASKRRGVHIGNQSTPKGAPDTGSLLWGCRLKDDTPKQCLDGWSLDEVALYDHALSSTRVKARYDAGK